MDIRLKANVAAPEEQVQEQTDILKLTDEIFDFIKSKNLTLMEFKNLLRNLNYKAEKEIRIK